MRLAHFRIGKASMKFGISGRHFSYGQGHFRSMEIGVFLALAGTLHREGQSFRRSKTGENWVPFVPPVFIDKPRPKTSPYDLVPCSMALIGK